MSGTYEVWKPAERDEIPCRKCKAPGNIEWRSWESSCGGYEDYQYRCKACGGSWWIDGHDA